MEVAISIVLMLILIFLPFLIFERVAALIPVLSLTSSAVFLLRHNKSSSLKIIILLMIKHLALT